MIWSRKPKPKHDSFTALNELMDAIVANRHNDKRWEGMA